jgi:hypothetical protein
MLYALAALKNLAPHKLNPLYTHEPSVVHDMLSAASECSLCRQQYIGGVFALVWAWPWARESVFADSGDDDVLVQRPNLHRHLSTSV